MDDVDFAVRKGRWYGWSLCVGLLFASLVVPVHGWRAVSAWVILSTGLVYLVAAWIATTSFSVARRCGSFATMVVVPGLASVAVLYLRHQTDHVQILSRPILSLLLWLLVAVAMWALATVVPVVGARWTVGTSVVSVGVATGMIIVLYSASPESRWFLMQQNRALGACVSLWLDSRPDSVDAYLADTGLPLAAAVPRAQVDDVRTGRFPNIVFLLVDTLRADALTALGGEHASMPRLDALVATEGFLFTDVWANATWTRPSMAAWFTGMIPEAVGVRDENDRLPDDAWTLAEMLLARGYSTVGFSTNGHVSGATGFDQGFDEFERLRGDSYVRADEVRRRVERWLQVGRAERPVFMYVHLMDPHTPYKSGVGGAPWLPYHNVAGYRADLRFLDEHLAELIASLRTHLGPDTWFVLGSDHGESFGERGVWDHGYSLYSSEAWVPVLVIAPGPRKGESAARLETRDFYRLFDALARPNAPSLDEWASAAHRETRYLSSYKTPTSALIRWLFPYRTVRLQGLQERDTLTIRNDFGDIWETYDLSRDPDQHRPRWPLNEGGLDRVWREMNRVVGVYAPGEGAVLSEEETRRLRALGYVR